MGTTYTKHILAYADGIVQEVEALTDLSNALFALVKSQAMQYVKAEIIRRTVLASLMGALSPIAWLKIGRVFGQSLSSATLPTLTSLQTTAG